MGAEEDLPTLSLLACVIAGVVVAIGVFAATYSLLVALLAYILTACASFAVTWVLRQ